jgi:rfaE bifunctional protein nucleotidyltransferase chain/domain
MGTVSTFEEAVERVHAARSAGARIVFTNGCFDLLHVGHLDLLERARALGDLLVVGVNGDESVRRLKGADRPLVPFADRARLLAGLAVVDVVVGFDDDTPLALIRAVEPDVLVKGGDWSPDRIVGRDVVEARGGEVRSLPLLPGHSTTALVERLRQSGSR